VGSSSLRVVVTIRLFAISWQGGEDSSTTSVRTTGLLLHVSIVHSDLSYEHIPNRVNVFETFTMLPGLCEVSLATNYSVLGSSAN